MKNKLLTPLITISFIGGLGLNIAHGAALSFEDGFENRSLGKWNSSGMLASVTNSPTRTGNYAVKFDLNRDKDKIPFRSELVIKKGHNIFKMDQEYWIGASIFIPNSWVDDSYGEILLQFHAVPDKHLGEGWSGRNPPLSLAIRNGSWRLQNFSDPNPVSRNRNYQSTSYNLGAYKEGQWTDWVFRIKWSYKNNGILEVWKNGQKVVNKNGPNTFNDQVAPYLKIGIYKPSWIPGVKWANKSSSVKTRTVYHDEIRIAGSSASYNDVAPGRRR